jgi:VanZ family protein
MPRKLLFETVAWACLCFTVYATLSPRRDRPILLISSNVEYLAAFVVFVALLCLAYPRRIPTVLIFVLSNAALLEVLQLLTPDRHARTLDAVQKIAGGPLVSSPVARFCRSTKRVRGSRYNLDSARPGRPRDPKAVSISV